MKRLVAFLLALTLMCCLGMPVYADETDETRGQTWFTATEVDTGIAEINFNTPMAGNLVYTIYYNAAAITSGKQELKGVTKVEVGLPVHRLAENEYTVTFAYYDNENEKIAEDTLNMTMGCNSPVLSTEELTGMEILANPIEQTKAILTPYAKVYSSSTLVGEPVAELKRHDIVQVNSISDGVAYITYMIQSGNGQLIVEDDVNTRYESSDDLVGKGYINANAFKLEDLSYESDIQREVVELTYARLGTKGVYSQARRYSSYYLDCAALACWAWHQVGIDTYNGAYTSCNGISSWALGKSGSDNVILWTAMEDYTSAQLSIAAIKAANDITGDIVFDGGIPEDQVLDYMESIDKTVWEDLQPGDIILFNYLESLTYNGISFGSHYVNQNGSGKGFDHAAVVVGFSSDGQGGKDKNVLTIIETASPSTEASENTKVSTISFSSSRAQQIKMVVRPTGCKRMDPSGITSSQYSGTYYADIGDLSAPVDGFGSATAFTNGCQFGYRVNPVGSGYAFHSGIDINGGNVPGVGYGSNVKAAADGEVIYVSNTCPHYMPGAPICNCGGTYGNYIIIQHNDSTKTLYAHLKPDITVSAGQKVKAGDVIGHVGTSGSSTGPHLHFEVRYNNTPTNPLLYIKK